MIPSLMTLLSAVFLAASFPPWNLAGCMTFALVPWLLALLKTSSRREAVLQGVLLSTSFSCLTFYWVAGTLHEFGMMSWPPALLLFLLFAPLNQPIFILGAIPLRECLLRLTSKDSKAPALSGLFLLVAAALLYSGVDTLFPKLFRDTLGHAFHDSSRIRQVADLGGASLLTFLVMASNLALAAFLRRVREREERSVWPAWAASRPSLLLAFVLWAAAWGYGYQREKQVLRWMQNPRHTFQAALIQGNIGDFEKVAAEKGVRGAARKILDTYFSLSDEALTLQPKPEVVIWPETAYPSTFRTPMTSDELLRDQQVEAWTRSRKVPILFGGYDHSSGLDYNALFFLHPEPKFGFPASQDLAVYRKNILLMFGEYLPGGSWFPFLKNLFPMVANFGRGVGPETIAIPIDSNRVVRTGPIICYEALFPSYILDAARKGSELILNITNDSWFGDTAEPELHLSLTRFRSIEARVPQLRGTNTGISALVLPDGSIARSTPTFRPGILNVTVPVLPPLGSLQVRWGDWFPGFSLLVGGLILFLELRRSRRNALLNDTH